MLADDLPAIQMKPVDAPPAEPVATGDANFIDLANRLKEVVAELETGVPTEPGDLLSPSEKLRALADLIDRRAATATPPTGS